MQLRFTQDIESLLKLLANQPLSLADILETTSERGFSLVIGLLTFPFLFPVPPGVSTVLGYSSLFLAVQMALGRRSPWLPRKMAQFKFPNWLVRQLLTNLKRVTGILEKLTKPRMRAIAESPAIWRLNGLCIAWLALLLMLPIPFTNPLPTAGILLLVVATLETDGLLMCLCYGLTFVITCFFAGIVYLPFLAPELLPNLFQ